MELTMAFAAIPVPGRLEEASVAVMAAQLLAVDDAPVVVLQGTPGRFCLGMDFGSALAFGAEGAGGAAIQRALGTFAHCLKLIMECPRPTLALVDGPAIGGGLGLAAACDFVLATNQARLGLPEGLYGLAPAIIRPALLTRLKPQQLNLLLFTCHTRSAEEAALLGLVDRVVPTDQFDRAARDTIRQLSRTCSRTVVTSRSWAARDIEHGLLAGLNTTAAALQDTNVLEALQSAGSKEDPLWTP
jgi:enoyl-CoA hydratase/carnithine racemase